MNTFKKVIEWLEDFDPVVDEDDVKSDLVSCYEFDGYEFCCNLERNKYWNVDAILVGILDGTKQSDFK